MESVQMAVINFFLKFQNLLIMVINNDAVHDTATCSGQNMQKGPLHGDGTIDHHG
jgi:hypothetical protein